MLTTSARHGWGIDELRAEIAKRVAQKKATRSRLEADVRAAAERLQAASGAGSSAKLSQERVAALDDALAEAAGIELAAEFRTMTSEPRTGALLPEHLVEQQVLNGKDA